MQEAFDTNKSISIGLDALWAKYVDYERRAVKKTVVLSSLKIISYRIQRIPVKDLNSVGLICRYVLVNEKPKNALTTLKYLSHCCEWGLMNGLISHNPFIDIIDNGLGIPFGSSLSNIQNKDKHIDFLLTGWMMATMPSSMPVQSGVYVIHGGESRDCLYVGQSVNLYKRGSEHWAWKKALKEYESAYIAYKLIECSEDNNSQKDLTYNECLLIGLLRPIWNAGTPAPSSGQDLAGNNNSIQEFHWSEIHHDKYSQNFHRDMLTEQGFTAIKMIKVKTENSDLPSRIWVKVLYDRDYVLYWVKQFYYRIPESEMSTFLDVTRKIYRIGLTLEKPDYAPISSWISS